MKPRIITLSPRKDSDNTITVATFEEAFGEFSEFKGRARARRQKRKRTRIARKTERKQAKQQMRTATMQSKQARKMGRKQNKVARKQLGQEEEDPIEQGSADPNAGYVDTTATDPNAGYVEDPNAGYVDEGGGYAPEPVGGELAPEEYAEESTEDYGGGDEYAEEFEGADGDNTDNDDYDYTADADNKIDLGAEDYFINVDGKKQKIHPSVKDIAKKIEWNKELLSRLQLKLQNAKTDAEKEQLNASIKKRQGRIGELEAKLEGYSSARGKGKAERNSRREVRKAKVVARKERVRATKVGKKVGKMAKKIAKKMPMGGGVGGDGGSETPVDRELNPEMGNNSIEIPASEQGSGADGQSGLIGMDNINDFDAPEVREYDVKFASVEGDKAKKINWKPIVIGVAVGVVTIWLIRKYKVFGTK